MSGIIDTTVGWLTVRQLFVRRRLVAAVVFALVPAAVALIYRIGHADGADTLGFVAMLYSEIVIGTLLPLAALVFGTTAFGGEIDDGTIVYLLVKPVPRWRVVLTKYLVAAAATLAVMLPGILLPWAVLSAAIVPREVATAFIAAGTVGAVLYSGLFVLLGIVTRRSLVIGLGYIIALEFVLSRSFDGLKSISIREYVLTMAARMAESHPDLIDSIVSVATVWTMGAIIIAGSLIAAVVSLQRYEMAERA